VLPTAACLVTRRFNRKYFLGCALYVRSASVKVTALLTLPVTGTSFTARLAAVVGC